MKIAITQKANNLNKIKRFDSLEQNYINFYKHFKITLIPIPNSLSNPVDYFKKIGATHLILSGGGDIHPKLYKGDLIKTVAYAQDRDNTETKLLEYASVKKIPVLGICRGCQFINIFFGGSLIQNLQKNLPNAINHVHTNHQIVFTDQKIKSITKKNKINVNSYHNDGLTKNELSKDLIAFTQSADGVIEGLYHKKLPIAGIMWHPERKKIINSFDNKLINSFINNQVFWK